MAVLPKTLTTADATLYTASAFYVHALILPRVPTHPPLGRIPSILIKLEITVIYTMLKDLFHLIFYIVIHQYQIF